MTKRYSKTIFHGAWAAAALILAGGLLLSGCKGSTPEPEKGSATTQVQGAEYTCPMHPEVLSDRPGKCPQCGMNLEKIQYTCPMHPEVLSDAPGKCPECGMNLEKKMPGGQHEAGHKGHGYDQQ